MNYVVVGFVTEASIKLGCPKPLDMAVQGIFPNNRDAVKWAKAAKLRDVTILEERTK